MKYLDKYWSNVPSLAEYQHVVSTVCYDKQTIFDMLINDYSNAKQLIIPFKTLCAKTRGVVLQLV